MEIGARVWIEDDHDIWLSGIIHECLEGDFVRVRLEDQSIVTKPSSTMINGKIEPIIHVRNEQDDFKNVPDLISLQYLHEPELLYAVCNRYQHDMIYTYIGEILLSFNPFQRLHIYSHEEIQMYSKSSKQDIHLPPHVYAIAANAYKSLCDEKKNQSILVSGESGAGKTENTKFLMQYLTDVGAMNDVVISPVKTNRKNKTKTSSPGLTGQIQTKILQTNPILEAFGNARTVRNDNSSRFGKFIELQFGSHHKIVGAKLSVYLLEKIRVSHQSADERNFHIFYELCCGADDELAARLSLADAEDFDLLNESGCYTRRDGVDDYEQFQLTSQAFTDMGIPDDERLSIYGIVSALLHLGNVGFTAIVSKSSNMEEANIDPATGHHLDTAAKLLGVSSEELTKALITRQVATTKDKITINLTPFQATEAKQSLTQSLYGGLFKWIVNRLSMIIRHDSSSVNTVGILDIFGFENLQTNGFEQLCINYANERLQSQFNELVFAKEQKMYEAEGIEWKYIEYPDNAPCLQLLEDRPHGMWCLLDEEGMLPKGSNVGWISKLYSVYLEDDTMDMRRRQSEPAPKLKLASSSHIPAVKPVRPFFATSSQRVEFQFVIGHFAGRVMYENDAFLQKNQDALPAEAIDLCGSSSNAIVQALLHSTSAPSKLKSSKPPVSVKKPPPISRQRSTIRAASVSSQFKSQLDDLIQVIASTQARYIRCVKPNDRGLPRELNKSRVVQQLRSGGVLEAVRIARAGYAVRVDHSSFMESFGFFKLKRAAKDTKAVCEQVVASIMIKFYGATNPDLVDVASQVVKMAKFDRRAFQQACGIAGFQIGNSKIFFRKDVYNDLRQFRRHTLAKHATTIQCHVRRFLARRLSLRKKAAVDLLQSWMRKCLAYRARVRWSVLKLQTWTRTWLAMKHYKKSVECIHQLQGWIRHALWLKSFAAKVYIRVLAKPKVVVSPPQSKVSSARNTPRNKPPPIETPAVVEDNTTDDVVASLTLQNEHLKQELEWLRNQTTTQLQIQMSRTNERISPPPTVIEEPHIHYTPRTSHGVVTTIPPLNELEFAHQQIISLSQQLLVTQIKYSNLLMDYNEHLSGYDADKPSISEDAFAMVEDLDIPCPASLECAQEQMRSLLRKLHMAKEKLKHLETDMMRNTEGISKPTRGESIDAVDFNPRRSSEWRPHFDERHLPSIHDWPAEDDQSETDPMEYEQKVEELQRQVDMLRMSLIQKPKSLVSLPTSSTVSTRSSIGSMTEGQQLELKRSFGYPPATTPRRLAYHVKNVTTWARDDKCFECKVEFGFFTRRHHCRMCGQSFCHEHSNRKARLEGVGSENEDEPARVCDICFVEICMESRRQEQMNHRRQGAFPSNGYDEGIRIPRPSFDFFLSEALTSDTIMFFGGGGNANNNPFGINFGFGNSFPQSFDEHYRVYPVSFCGKSHLEDGDKILLPPSALETLARLHIDYPMLFKIKNEAVERISHCGVLEFSAPEGSCYMPYWMMQNMFLAEGGIVNIQNVTLPKATFAKIRPQSTDFHDISNPRAVLEATLRKFSCMTVGDTISITYNDRNYLLDVRELRPADAVCIIETDCELDFDAPADYIPPTPVQAPVAAPDPKLPFGGIPSVKSQDVKARPSSLGGGLRLKKSGSNTDADALRAARLKKYEAFHGQGVSLSGAVSSTPPLAVPAPPSSSSSETKPDVKPPAAPFEGLGRRLR